MLKLTQEQRRSLREQAHGLDPVVMVGEAGLSENVLNEISRSLDAHGLIKVRVFGDDRANRIEILQTICSTLQAAPIQHIGKLLVIYRPKAEKKPAFSETKKSVGSREVKIVRTRLSSRTGTARKTIKKVQVKGNERVAAGGKVKRIKVRKASSKKKSLA
jgi:putative YhbY family RNA-binding protein